MLILQTCWESHQIGIGDESTRKNMLLCIPDFYTDHKDLVDMKKPIFLLFSALLMTTSSFAQLSTLTVPGSSSPQIVSPIKFTLPGHSGTQHFSAVDPNGKKWPVTIRDGHGVLVAPSTTNETTYTIKKAEKYNLRIKKDKKSNRLDIFLGKELFTSFHYQDERVKPYLWPLNADGEVGVSRDWPIGERNKTKDHPHHESFYTAYGDINDTDFWAFSSNKGFQKTTAGDRITGAAYSTIYSELTWHKEDGTPVVDEQRTYTFYNTPSEYRIFDLKTTLIAAHGDAKFDDTKEGGMATVRMNDDLREVGGSGTITNSEGGVGAGETWGKPAAWCDYSGSLDGVGNLGITIMDHPTSFRYPTHWHVRDYGLMGANAFGYSYFYEKTDSTKNGDLLLKKGESITFNYRIYIHKGDVNEANVAAQYANFSKPLVASAR